MITTEPFSKEEISAYRKKFAKQSNEEVLKDNPGRWVILPIQYGSIWDLFKRYEMSFWTAEEMDFSKDLSSLTSVDPPLPACTYEAIKAIVAEQAALHLGVHGKDENASTVIVPDIAVYTCQLFEEIQIPEARAFYGFQVAYENIHKEVYCMWLRLHATTSSNPDKDNSETVNCVQKVAETPAVKEKYTWFCTHFDGAGTDSEIPPPFAEKLVTWIALKLLLNDRLWLGQWLQKKSIMPGLAKGLTKIAENEEMENEFATILYASLRYRMSRYDTNRLVTEAAYIQYQTSVNVLGREFLEFVFGSMEMYEKFLKFQTKRVMKRLGYRSADKITRSPVSWYQFKDSGAAPPLKNTAAGTSSKKSALEHALAEGMKFSLNEDF